MVNCWAEELENCCGRPTKEHLISKALFPSKHITVQGFSWCKGESKKVSIDNITAKILCRHHNNSLSNLDAAAAYAFNSFQKVFELVRKANDSEGLVKIKSTNVNALMLERWLLKTLINLCYEKEHFIGNSNQVGMPDKLLVDICFGIKKFSGGSGMYIAANMGDMMKFGPYLTFSPLIEESKNTVVAGMFRFAGLLMFLWLKSEPIPNNFDWIQHDNSDWTNVQPSRPFKKIKFRIASGKYHTLYFTW